MRSWVPFEGPYHGWLISHGEAISIPDYLTVRENVAAPLVEHTRMPIPEIDQLADVYAALLHRLLGRDA